MNIGRKNLFDKSVRSQACLNYDEYRKVAYDIRMKKVVQLFFLRVS